MNALPSNIDMEQQIRLLEETAQGIDRTALQNHYLSPRKRDAHKGNFGHVLVIGGDAGMSGAVRLAGEAAARVGAGLVSIATQPAHATLIGTTRPELMCHGIKNAKDLMPLLEKATVVIIGPGLGQTPWAQELLAAALTHNGPIIIDADALNLLAGYKNKLISYERSHWIITPHPGEAARLLNCDTATVQTNRYAAIHQLQHQFGCVCVLKGAGTLVLGNDAGAIPQICIEGNPGMASGGMGDVLSGVIGGLVAQGLELSTASCLGVAVHARAGDLAASNGGERGLLASDLFPYLRQLVNM
jgi:hydroxyethylthiazole kinase-like uncharacterized protein yjeF